MKNILYYTLLIITSFLLLNACQEPNSNITKTIKNEESSNENPKKTILFFGNSITAAYGLEPNEAFSSLIQLKIDSMGLEYTCVNAGNSGETTKGGLSRLDWVLKEPIDIFVLELGANDGLRGYSVEETQKNLIQIIKNFKAKNPESKVLLAGMKVPPNMGDEYFLDFEKMYSDIAVETGVSLIPFLLENVAGIQSLNLPDGIHPTAEGHKIVSETVWKSLFPLLEKPN